MRKQRKFALFCNLPWETSTLTGDYWIIQPDATWISDDKPSIGAVFDSLQLILEPFAYHVHGPRNWSVRILSGRQIMSELDQNLMNSILKSIKRKQTFH